MTNYREKLVIFIFSWYATSNESLENIARKIWTKICMHLIFWFPKLIWPILTGFLISYGKIWNMCENLVPKN